MRERSKGNKTKVKKSVKSLVHIMKFKTTLNDNSKMMEFLAMMQMLSKQDERLIIM